MNNISQNSSRLAPPFSIQDLRSFAAEVHNDQAIVLNRNDRGDVQNPPLIVGEFNGHQLINETSRHVNAATRDAVYMAIGAARDNTGRPFYSGATIDAAFEQAGLSPENPAVRGEPITGSRMRIILENLDNHELSRTRSDSVSTIDSGEEDQIDDSSLNGSNRSSIEPPLEQFNTLNIEPGINNENDTDSVQSLSEQNNIENNRVNHELDMDDWMDSEPASNNDLNAFLALFQQQETDNQNRNQQLPPQ